MKNYPDDIFKKPKIYFDKNNQLRISNMDLINILENKAFYINDFYNFYSNKKKMKILMKKFVKIS